MFNYKIKDIKRKGHESFIACVNFTFPNKKEGYCEIAFYHSLKNKHKIKFSKEGQHLIETLLTNGTDRSLVVQFEKRIIGTTNMKLAMMTL